MFKVIAALFTFWLTIKTSVKILKNGKKYTVCDSNSMLEKRENNVMIINQKGLQQNYRFIHRFFK